MLRNYIAAAFGNLSRNWLYSGITILGLAVSFAAAILIGLYLRDEYSFDRFVPDYQRVYRIAMDLDLPGEKPLRWDTVMGSLAANLKLDFPEIERTARMELIDISLRHGDFEATEPVGWVDPGFFRIMRFPVLAGDPDAAIEAPDGLVLTREMARKYFGEDAPIGKTLEVSTAFSLGTLPPAEAQVFAARHPMRVLAVLNDLPASSHLSLGVFGSGRAAVSLLALDDRHPSDFNATTLTYVKLKPGASAAPIQAGMAAFANRRYPGAKGASSLKFYLLPLADLHFPAHGSGEGERPPGDRAVDAGIAAVGALIIIIAAINFVTLMTARATRRAVEVGVRKAVGARRRDLVGQFLGEALIYVLLAMLIGVALAELLLPNANAFLGRTLRFDYLSDPRVLAAIVGVALVTALLAGAYPALVMSGFRPAAALKGGAGRSTGSATVRQALVIAQFAILIGLVVMTATVYRQTSFALKDAVRVDTDQILRMSSSCEPGFKHAITALPGVKAVACASGNVVAGGSSHTFATAPGRPTTGIASAPVDVGFFELQGLKPLAGRFFSAARGQDVMLENDGPDYATDQPSMVLNESGALQLGFKTPQEAVGKTISWARWGSGTSNSAFPPFRSSEIVGVVPDFTLQSIRTRIDPTIYYVDPVRDPFIVAKLDGRRIPETLAAIDRIWAATGHDRGLPKAFENQSLQDLYKDVITQEIAIAVCTGLAILIACLGLFALAAFTTERRIKEIGVRKAMGASSLDVMRLLLWQFTKPVLWANLIAWPLAFWAMDHWLHGFAYRVGLPAWLFLLAAAVAVLIAWATVSVHAWLAARARPATALRYE